MSTDAGTFADWLSEVCKALDSINMSMETWHAVWPFDFAREFADGTAPSVTALKANRFWWRQQNQRIDQDWILRFTTGGAVPAADTPNRRMVMGRRHGLNQPTATTNAENFSRPLLHNAVAISALVHRSSDYAAFCRRVPGLPGIWSLCIDAAEEFTKQELRIRSQEETDDTYSFEWLDAIDKYADAILKLEPTELDRSSLGRLARQIIWGD
ncbi:MAG TPA: hypothetical protein VIH91_02965 [Terriglobales bacterium]